MKNIIFLCAILLPISAISKEEPKPGLELTVKFGFQDEIKNDDPIFGICKEATARSIPLLTDAAVAIAGKVVSGVIDKIATKTKAEAVTTEAVGSMEGFYTEKEVAASDGCLAIYNGEKPDASDSTINGLFKVQMSEDNTAFRFVVKKWIFKNFLANETSQWLQEKGRRDFVFRIEFLSPGAEGVGKRAIFIEKSLENSTPNDVQNAFKEGQYLPWFAAPSAPKVFGKKRSVPLNIKVTVLETTKPMKIATWLSETAQENKAALIELTKTTLRESLDSTVAAESTIKLTNAAAEQYIAYKTSWDACFKSVSDKPAQPQAAAKKALVDKYNVDLAGWQSSMEACKSVLEAKRIIASDAFHEVPLTWPGDLPSIDF